MAEENKRKIGRPADKSLKTPGGTYKSQVKASMKYDEALDQVKFKVPKGWRDEMKIYAKEKGISVNEMLTEFVKQEIGEERLNTAHQKAIQD